jgi:hypothetical protein
MLGCQKMGSLLYYVFILRIIPEERYVLSSEIK